MSYRTYVNGCQLFDNNDYYAKWLEFVKSQGIKISQERCYEGEITDFMGAMAVIEDIVLDMDDGILAYRDKFPKDAGRHPSLFDLRGIRRTIDAAKGRDRLPRPMLFDELYDHVTCGYLFLPLMFYDACKDDLRLDVHDDTRFRSYVLKPGKTMHVEAH